jgi:predicted nucleic acid-binding protein
VRVFPDTNVLASAFGTRGLCADVIRLILGEHELLTGEVVIEELRRVLRRKFGVPADAVKEIESLLRGYHVEPKPRQLPDLELSEPGDLLVVASAVKAEAEILITGDKEMLDLKEKPKGLRIISPREFWNVAARKPRKRPEN